jgi:hypothetical protein
MRSARRVRVAVRNAVIGIKNARAFASFFHRVSSSIDLAKAEELLSAFQKTQVPQDEQSEPHRLSFPRPPLALNVPKPELSFAGFECSETEATFYDVGVIVVSPVFLFSGTIQQAIALSEELYRSEQLKEWAGKTAHDLAQQLRTALADAEFEPAGLTYRFFCIDDLHASCETSMMEDTFPDELTQLLRGSRLHFSDDEIESALDCRASLTTSDFALIDEDAALLVKGSSAEIRQMIEVCLLQIVSLGWGSREMERRIDRGVEFLKRRISALPFAPVSYSELAQINPLGPAVDFVARTEGLLPAPIRRYYGRVYELVEERLDLKTLREEFQDQVEYLERIYQQLSETKGVKNNEFIEWLIIIAIVASIVVGYGYEY